MKVLIDLMLLNIQIHYKMKQIIRKVWKNKGSNQLLITIPNISDIKEGDYVEVRKVSIKYEEVY